MSALHLMLALGLSSAVWPPAGVTLCIFMLAIQIVLILIRMAVTSWDLSPSFKVRSELSPIFSVHVATHNEPAAMVASTLRALAVQTWPADGYEVIVMDNNTSDLALWGPVEALCRTLGSKFTFLHRMGIPEAKAGALNIALAHTRSDATHIVTVDADYRVDRQFLSTAAEALRLTGSDYVQFPQAYVGSERLGSGVDAELEEYFHTNAQMADDAEAVLLTGTLSVISKPALIAAGGWSGRTTTEDAEMGVRLCRKGFSGRFVGKIVGRGYLPFSLRDLERQRHRWASGNLQTLFAHAPAIVLGRDSMGWRRRGAIVSQLTAWLNWSLLPALLLIVALFAGQNRPLVVALASASILLTAADIMGRLSLRGLRDGMSLGVLAAAIGNRFALAPVSALATI